MVVTSLAAWVATRVAATAAISPVTSRVAWAATRVAASAPVVRLELDLERDFVSLCSHQTLQLKPRPSLRGVAPVPHQLHRSHAISKVMMDV